MQIPAELLTASIIWADKLVRSAVVLAWRCTQ